MSEHDEIEKPWRKSIEAVVFFETYWEFFIGSEYFFQQLQYQWERRKAAGKSLTVAAVCSYFSEVDKANDEQSINLFREAYKGGTILNMRVHEGGRVWIRIQMKQHSKRGV